MKKNNGLTTVLALASVSFGFVLVRVRVQLGAYRAVRASNQPNRLVKIIQTAQD
jgi:hypothetical protein